MWRFSNKCSVNTAKIIKFNSSVIDYASTCMTAFGQSGKIQDKNNHFFLNDGIKETAD